MKERNMLHPEEIVLADIQEYTKQAMMNEPLQKEAQWQGAKSLWRSLWGGAAKGALKAAKPGALTTIKNFIRPGSLSAPNKAITKALTGNKSMNVIKGGFMPGHAGRLSTNAGKELLSGAQRAGVDLTSRSALREFAKNTYGGAGKGNYNFVDKAYKMWGNPTVKADFLRGQAFDLRNVAPGKITSSMAKSLHPSDLKYFKNKNVSQRTSDILGNKPILPTPTARVNPSNMNPAAPGIPLPTHAGSKPQAGFTPKQQRFTQDYSRGGAWNDPSLQKQWGALNSKSKAGIMESIKADASLGGAFGKLQTMGWGALNPVEKSKLLKTGLIGFVGQRVVLQDKAIL